MQEEWMHHTYRRVMIGSHTPDYDQLERYACPETAPTEIKRYRKIMTELDPQRLVRDLKKAGAEMFYYYAKCHYGNAYYPSRVPGAHVHSALRGRDLFGEYTAACLKWDIIPGAVYEFSDHRMATDHPDWCHYNISAEDLENADMTDDIEGAKIAGGCLNGPYGEFAIQQMLEVVRAYPIRAYYMDFMGLFGDYDAWACPFCGKIFERDFGFPFRGTNRLTPDQKLQYNTWRYEQYDRYARRFIAALRAERPDIAFTHNFFGITDAPGQTEWARAVAHCDYMSKDSFSLRLGTLPISWRTRALVECGRKAPVDMLLDSMTCLESDVYTPKPLDGYRAELWTARCAGAAVCASLIPSMEGSYHTHARPVLAMIENVFKEQEAYEPWLRDLHPLAEVAILRSRHTIESRPEEGAESGLQHARDFYGWCEVLISSQRLWTILQDHHLTDEDLARFRVLILPNVSSLGDAQCAVIDRFVRRGGVMIASGETSLLDEAMQTRKTFGLQAALGVSAKGGRQLAWNTATMVKAPFLPRERWHSAQLYFREGQWSVRAGRTTTVFAETGAHPFRTMCRTIRPTGAPGLTYHRHGKGGAWYFAGLVGGHYHRHGQHTTHRVMNGVLDRALGRRSLVAVDGAGTLECFAHTRSGHDGMVVSLVHMVSGVNRSLGIRGKEWRKHDMIDAVPRLHEARVTLNPPAGRTVKRVRLAPTGQALRVQRKGRRAEVRLENLDVITMLDVEFARSRGPSASRRA